MLDAPRLLFSVPSAGWQNDMSYGDIVLFRFPGAGQPAAARPAIRPCLVLETTTAEVLLAYGTSSRGRASKGLEIVACDFHVNILAR